MSRRKRALHFSQSLRIIIFILLFLVLLVVYSVIFQAIQRSELLRREQVSACDRAFSLMLEQTEEQFSELSKLASVVHQGHYLRKLARQEYSIVDVLRGKKELDQLLASNRLLNQVYYYVKDDAICFTVTDVYPYPESEKYFAPLSGVNATQMQALLENSAAGMYVLPACSSATSVEQVIPVILAVPYNAVEPYATVLLEVREDKLLRAILPAGLGDGVVCEFYREDGTLLFANQDTAFATYSERTEEGLPVYEAEGKRYYLFEEADYGKAGLTYRMYVPESAIQVGSFTPLQMRLMIAACIGMLLLLCPVLYFWTYQPMRMLIEQLMGTQGGSKRVVVQADYAIALREIEQLRLNNNSLLWKIDSNMNLVRVSLLRHLIEFGRASDDFLALCRHADLNFQHRLYRLLLIAPPEGAPQSEVSQYAKVCRPGTDVYVVRTPELVYALVNADQKEGLNTAGILPLVRASGVIGQEENVHYVGSGWTEDVARLQQEYRTALEKLNRRVFHDMQPPDEETAAGEAANRQYPVNEILQLQDGVMEHDQAKVKDAVLSVQNYLLHENTPAAVAVLAANDVLQMLQKSSGADLGELIASVRRKGRTAADICQILKQGMQVVEEAGEREEDTLTEEMMLYISEMLEDPNLSIATVSEHFHLSESAFSHAFKKRTGGTFVKYVTDLKIQRAKSLLICTELSIEAIADQLNYSSASSFARMFKAETSFTPTQYRKLREKTEQI